MREQWALSVKCGKRELITLDNKFLGFEAI